MTKKKKLTASLVSLAVAATMTGTSLAASADALKYGGKFYSDYLTHDEVVAEAEELNIQIAGEGMVLLKNERGTLPFKKDVTNLSVFGMRSDNLLLAGTGSGSVRADTAPSLKQSLNEAGFKINPALVDFYAKDTNKQPDPKNEFFEFGRNITDSYKSYNDAAVIIFSRLGGENADVSTDVGEAADAGEHIEGIVNKHYLEFTNAEQKLMEHVAANFDKVVVVLNSSNPMELKELDAEKYGVDAAIWMSQPGQNGIMALGKILNGEINPSGKLVDLFEKDFTSSIVWNNYGTGVQAVNNDGSRVYNKDTNPYPNVYRTEDGEIYGTVPQGNSPGTGFTEVQYEEGIYLGYAFYETMAYEMNLKEAGSGDTWYDANVMYPFGHGLSYTKFNQTIKGVFEDESCKTPITAPTGEEETIYVQVEVENTGKVAGKDVVQIYVNAPYYENEIEKSYVKLVGFGKSEIIEPEQSDTVVVKINTQDMASFDANDANHNNHNTYELDAGDYKLFAMKNSHVKYDECSFNLGEDKILGKDDFSDKDANPLFSSDDEYNLLDYYKGELKMDIVSRMDFRNGTYTQPEAATAEELKRDGEWFDRAVLRDYYAVADDGADDGGYTETPWAEEEVPEAWTQGKGVKDENGHYATVLADMTGVAFDDDKWVSFMNQLTWEELVAAVQFGSYGTAAIPSIDKEQSYEPDGPISLSGGFAWCVAPLQAATFNTKLIERLGVLTANQAMLRWQDSSYTRSNMLAGWYGPAMNTHRSHFLGRTFEYYSEDGILGGYMGAAVVGGAQSKGLNCWIKHFVLNEQEIYRKGLNTYCTEQAFREIYCKPFQMAIQEGNATAIMTSFNRIGQVAAAVNYNLITKLVREEWGFDGVIVTDMYNSNCWPSTMLLRAGNDLPLGTVVPEGEWDATARGGQGSVKVTSVSNFSSRRSYAKGDYASTGRYQGRKLIMTYYEFVEAHPAGELDLAAEAKKADGIVKEVELKDIAEDVEAISDVQYYYVRLCAQRMLYTEANIMAGKNGYDLRDFKDKTLTAVAQGSAMNQSVAVDMGEEEAYYEVISGKLPEGVTLNKDGSLTGTPVGDAGTFEFTVRAVYDKWIQTTAKMTLTVNPVFTFTAGAAAEAGKPFAGAIDTTVFAENDKSYSLVGTLPAGLTLDEKSGEIVGTPTETGTFGAEVVVTVKSGNDTFKFNVPVTIEVGGTVAVEKTEIEILTEKLEAMETSGKASADEIAALKARIDELEKANEESGCGSVVNVGLPVALGFAGILGAAVVVSVAKKRASKDKE